MRRLLPEEPGSPLDADFPDELQAIIDAGWMNGPSGTLLLRAMYGGGPRKNIDLAEVGRYEYEINDVYVPTQDLADDLDAYLRRAARRGISFARQALGKAMPFPAAHALMATVNTGIGADFLLHGTTVKFFTRRGDFPTWFDDDLEKFEMDAVAVLTGIARVS